MTNLTKTTYVNLTPHAVTIYGDGDAVLLTVPPSGTVARLAEKPEPDLAFEGGMDGAIPRTFVYLGGAENMPEPQDGVTYIVSMPLLMGLLAGNQRRYDAVYPFGQVRDSAGRIIGCRSLAGLEV